MVKFGLCVPTWLGVPVERGWGHHWAWGLGGTMGHMGWWRRAVSCWWWWQQRRRCRACSWVYMISHGAAGRRAHGNGWPHWWGSCAVLPCWSHGLRLLGVWVVATRRHSRRGRCGLCRGQPRTRAGAGRLRRGMGCRTSHWRPGQQRLAWRSWVGSEWWARLVGTDWGSRLVWPRGIESRARGCGSFGLHWIVGRLVSHAIADPWQLLQGNWILWWTWRDEEEERTKNTDMLENLGQKQQLCLFSYYIFLVPKTTKIQPS